MSPWWERYVYSPEFMWIGAIMLFGMGRLAYLRKRRGRRLIKVWERPPVRSVVGRFVRQVFVRNGPVIDWWSIYEHGIELPNQFSHEFVRWDTLDSVQWRGDVLVLDFGSTLFRHDSGALGIEVPEDCRTRVEAIIAMQMQVCR